MIKEQKRKRRGKAVEVLSRIRAWLVEVARGERKREKYLEFSLQFSWHSAVQSTKVKKSVAVPRRSLLH